MVNGDKDSVRVSLTRKGELKVSFMTTELNQYTRIVLLDFLWSLIRVLIQNMKKMSL